MFSWISGVLRWIVLFVFSVNSAFQDGFKLYFKEGLAHFLRYLFSASRLIFEKSYRKRRLDNYEFHSNDPRKNGFLPQKLEKDLEYPQTADHLGRAADELFFYGVNCVGDTLLASFSRFQGQACEVWVYVRTKDGKTFAASDAVHLDRTTNDVFRGGGLSISCLSPMRRWRIAYNGVLTSVCENMKQSGKDILGSHNPDRCCRELDIGKPHHIRFSFIWTAMSDVYDYTCDVSPHLTAKSVANRPWIEFMSKFSRISSRQDTYEQGGQMRGVVSINGEKEKEIYLWGSRMRNLEEKKYWVGAHTEHYFGYTKEGLLFHSICEFPLKRPEFFHGFILEPDSVLYPLKRCVVSQRKSEGEISDTVRLHLKTVRKYSIRLKHYTSNIHSQHEGSLRFTLRRSEVHFENERGFGISLICRRKTPVNHRLPCRVIYPLSNGDRKTAMVLQIGDPGSEERVISGGKGASLVTLSAISEKIGNFSVAPGIIVTTTAYRNFIAPHQQQIDEILSTARTSSSSSLKEKCENVESMLSSLELSTDLRECIREQLADLFEDYNVSLAVRSSSVDEDGEGASFAGQMKTFLCVEGLDEICICIVRCWASQFSFESIQYKSQHGQDFNTPMAVVVQEMVESEVSGVIFTCDPMTGNPLKLVINANYGLGESVVGSTVEPDAVILERDLFDGLKISSTIIGDKSSKVAKGNDGTVQMMTVDSLHSHMCCISNSESLLLGDVALDVLEHYGTPLDIEFSISGSQIYLLQARPVTSLFRECDFDIIHENDTSLKTDKEVLCRGNFEEILPGAISPLSVSVFSGQLSYIMKNSSCAIIMPFVPTSPYFIKGLVSSACHSFVNLSDSDTNFPSDDGLFSKTARLALLGDGLDVQSIADHIRRRHALVKPSSNFQKTKFMIQMLWSYADELKKLEKEVEKSQFQADPSESSEEIFNSILHHLSTPCQGLDILIQCFNTAAVYNATILAIIAKSKGDVTPEVFSEHSKLLSGCDKLESLDISKILQSLTDVILRSPDTKKFIKMTDEEALSWLTSEKSQAGEMFRDFIKSHGHRCIQEVDLYSITWGQNPKSLVAMLQTLVEKRFSSENTKHGHIWKSKSATSIRMRIWNRLLVRFLLPRAKKAIVSREKAKSLFIRQTHELRLAFTTLGEKLVEEGKLSDPRLVFFLTLEEVDLLIREKPNFLLAKAARRKRLHEYMNTFQYANCIKGIPRPLHENKVDQVPNGCKQETASGVPVCQGIARGKANVIVNPADIIAIQDGDILIAKTTDIAWTPYFPLLSGIVTEVGGVLSHGSVIAREYGIPCIVSVLGATDHFQTGDIVEVDAFSGTVQKVTSLANGQI